MTEAVQSPSDAAPKPSALGGAILVFHHTVWQMIWGKKVFFVLAMAALPITLAILFDTVIPAEGATVAWFYLMITLTLFLHMLLPLTALAFAVGLVTDEVERGTLLYLLTRPIPKWATLVGKVAAYVVVSWGFGVGALLGTYAALRVKSGGAGLAEIGGLGAVLPALMLGLLAYGGLFIAVGTYFRKPLVVTVIFAFGWENLLGNLPGQSRLLSVQYYVRIMVSRSAGDPGGEELPMRIAESASAPSATASAIVLAAIFLGGVVLAILNFRRQQYALSRIQ